MTIRTIFLQSPLAGLALVCCLYTLLISIRLVRRMKWGESRSIIALIGLICIQQSLRVLRDVGMLEPRYRLLEGAVDLVMAVLFLTALLAVRAQARDLRQTKLHVRFLESNQRKLVVPNPLPATSAPKAPEVRTDLAS